MIVGVPGKILKDVTDEQVAAVRENARRYAGYAQAHKKALGSPVPPAPPLVQLRSGSGCLTPALPRRGCRGRRPLQMWILTPPLPACGERGLGGEGWQLKPQTRT